MDLASILSEGIEAASACQKPPKKTNSVPVVPGTEANCGNGQVIDKFDSSRSSRSSRTEIEPHGSDENKTAQACARARASGRARSYPVWVREQREQREQPAGSDTYSSRSLSLKRELIEKTGTAPLPAVSHPAAAPEFEERAAFLEYECGLSRAEAETQAQAEIWATDRLAAWRASLARLDAAQPPCPGYRSDEWRSTLARALAFLDTFGGQAEALGWTSSRLFGVHETAGIVRPDACGALVLPIGGEARAITATEVRFSHLTHRQKLGQPAGVPWWQWRS